jgi:uncharacterized protein YdeI (BOF family)
MFRLAAIVLAVLMAACSGGPVATSADRSACENVQKANQAVQSGSVDDIGADLTMATAARLADDHRLVLAGQILQEAANAVVHNNDTERSSAQVAAARIEDICGSLGVRTKATP